MSIRAKLAWWYGGILLISFLAMAGVMHYEWAEQMHRVFQEGKPPEPAWEEVGEILLYYGAPTMLVLLAGGWWIIRRVLAPVTTLTRAVERINLDNLQERLPPAQSSDELARLTEVFNAMMARLEDSFARTREFTLHASHELKTPLTIMRAEIESSLREGNWSPERRDLFANQLDEIERLTKIVDGLTFLAKADARQLRLKHEPVRLDELVNDSYADALMLARPTGVIVELDACEELTVRGDRHRLRQLLLNLTDNAIKHNRPGGRVEMELSRNNDLAELRISNTGAGIPPEKLPRVFDRFFRGDPAHGNEVPGCGLGLSIVQWIVKVHGGKIGIESRAGGLTTVAVQLPVVAAEPGIQSTGGRRLSRTRNRGAGDTVGVPAK